MDYAIYLEEEDEPMVFKKACLQTADGQLVVYALKPEAEDSAILAIFAPGIWRMAVPVEPEGPQGSATLDGLDPSKDLRQRMLEHAGQWGESSLSYAVAQTYREKCTSHSISFLAELLNRLLTCNKP